MNLKKLLRSKIVVVPITLLAVNWLVVGCGGDETTTTTEGDTTTTIDTPPPVFTAELTSTISGRVVDSSSGEGIAGATVSAVGVSATTAAADDPAGLAPGSFTLTDIPRTESNSPVLLFVTGATATGKSYPTTTTAVVGLPDPGLSPNFPVVEPVVTVAGVEIEVHDQGGTISGKILDATGNPLQGVAITVDAVQIPIITPSTGGLPPTTGVLPFELTDANSRGTTDGEGAFTISGVPEDWTYNIVVIPGGGTPNITFTNQYVPSGSMLNFPDVVGPPIDSGVVTSFLLAGGALLVGGAPNPAAAIAAANVPLVNGVALPCAAGACPAVINGAIAGSGPLAILPAVLPGQPEDRIAPYELATSQVVDGTTITSADNTAGRSFDFTMSEAVGNSLAAIQAAIRLTDASGAPISATVALTDNTISVTPNISVGTDAVPLPDGAYCITGIGALTDAAGNAYTGLLPDGVTADAASTTPVGAVGAPACSPGGVGDGTINFAVLADTGTPGAVTGVDCSNGCNNGSTAFTLTFTAPTGTPAPVQYAGEFSSGALGRGDTFTPCQDLPAPGNGSCLDATDIPFISPGGALANPPELVNFEIATPAGTPGSPINLFGFGFPLVQGTENNAAVPNNYFDDGIAYLVSAEGLSDAGLSGPKAFASISDNTAPAFDVRDAAVVAVPATANDINNNIGPLVPSVAVCGGGGFGGPPLGTANTCNTFTPLANIFAPIAAGDIVAESIPLTEGPTSTVGFDFFATAVAATPVGTGTEAGLAAPDTFYSAADLAGLDEDTAIAGVQVAGATNIIIDEEIDAGATLTAPALSNPALPGFTSGSPTAGGVAGPVPAGAPAPGAADYTVSLATVQDPDPVTGAATGDGINDENLIAVTFSSVLASPITGQSLDFSGSGIVDEVGNALAAKTATGAPTSLLVANAIASAIETATATRGTKDILELTFTRPIQDPADVAGLLAGGKLVSDLGLVDAAAFGLILSPNTGLAALLGSTVALSNGGRTLTITTPALGDLSNLTATTVISGVGTFVNPGSLLTSDALSFIAGNTLVAAAGMPVNTFASGMASILVDDQIPAGLANILTDATVAQINTTAQVDGDGVLQVGDTTADTFLWRVVFDSPVLVDTGAPGCLDDLPATAFLSFGNLGAAPTAQFSSSLNTAVDPCGIDPTGSTLLFNVSINPPLSGGGAVDADTTITVNNVTDASGLPVAPTQATLTAGGAAPGITIP
jgi:hypothetical protein